MPCLPITVNGSRGIVCTRGPASKPRRCTYCGAPSEFLCDWPKGKRTCDRPMCRNCAQEVDVDLHQCREHATEGLF